MIKLSEKAQGALVKLAVSPGLYSKALFNKLELGNKFLAEGGRFADSASKALSKNKLNWFSKKMGKSFDSFALGTKHYDESLASIAKIKKLRPGFVDNLENVLANKYGLSVKNPLLQRKLLKAKYSF